MDKLDQCWDDDRRVQGCLLHLDIREGRIWLQQNATEMRVAHELVAIGVPRQDIVLGFQAPSVREDTGFGVA